MKWPNIMNPLKEIGKIILDALTTEPVKVPPADPPVFNSSFESKQTSINQVLKSSIDLEALRKASLGDPAKMINVKAKWLLVVILELEIRDIFLDVKRDHSFMRSLALGAGDDAFVQVSKGYLANVYNDLSELQTQTSDFDNMFKDLDGTFKDFDKTFKNLDFTFKETFGKHGRTRRK